MYPHRIRLRGPWECEPIVRMVRHADGRVESLPGPVPAARRMTMPCRWSEGGLVDFTGRVRFRRHFGYPGRIDAHERIWLTFAGIEGTADVHLNGHFLGQPQQAPFECDVSNLLQARNHLEVLVEALTASGGIWGEVALEIRDCRQP